MRACGLMANNELSFAGSIELQRFMTALKYLNSSLTSDEIWFLASKSQCGNIETEEEKKVKYISFQTFIRSLRRALQETNELFA